MKEAILLASSGAESFWQDALRALGIFLGILLLAAVAVAAAQAIAKKAFEQFFIVLAAILFAPIFFGIKAIVKKKGDKQPEKEKHLKEKKVKEEKRPNGRKGDHVKKPD